MSLKQQLKIVVLTINGQCFGQNKIFTVHVGERHSHAQTDEF